MAATTPPRRNLTRRRYSLQPPSPQPHAGCGLTWTLPLYYDAFKPPSKREVNKWLASNKSASVLSLSPQASSKSPSILTLSSQDSSKSPSVLTLSPQSQSSPIPSPSGGAAEDDLDQPCEYLKLQEKNILEKQNKLKEIEIPALLPKKKSRRKRTKPKAADVVPRKSARLASRLNQDQDQEAADPPAAVNQEAAVSPAGGQEAAESPAGDQEAAVSAAAEGHKSAFDHVRHSLPSQKEKKRKQKHSLTADVQENRSVSKK